MSSARRFFFEALCSVAEQGTIAGVGLTPLRSQLLSLSAADKPERDCGVGERENIEGTVHVLAQPLLYMARFKSRPAERIANCYRHDNGATGGLGSVEVLDRATLAPWDCLQFDHG